MSAVGDLRKAIVEGNEPVTQLLRHAKLIAAKLNLSDIAEWVDWELKGYPKDVDVPRYGKIRMQTLQVHNPVHGWIYAGDINHFNLEIPYKHSIDAVVNCANGEQVGFPVPNGTNPFGVQDSFGEDCDYQQRMVVTGAQFKQVIEAVKTRLLEWTIELENRGIEGEGIDMNIDFNEKEKKRAENITTEALKGETGKDAVGEMIAALKGKVATDDPQPQPQEQKVKTTKEPKDLFASLSEDLENLAHRSWDGLDSIRKRAKLYITKVFGHHSQYLAELDDISFSPDSYDIGDEKPLDESWRSGASRLSNLLDVMYEDVELGNMGITTTHVTQTVAVAPTPAVNRSNKIFIVHGHDDVMKLSAARAVENFGLKAVILHERLNKGKTIIEKFEHNSNVGFAVVLLSPDDMAYISGKDAKTARPRPRQNVIFELGFFVGKLGRANVFVLYKKTEDFEMLSDYAGVVYQEFDAAGNWKLELARELSSAGYNIPKEALISED